MTREHSANNFMDTKTDTTTADQGAAVLVGSGPSFGSFEDVTTAEQRQEAEERYLRRLSPKCWISALYRRTGFGWMEWETAIVMLIEPGSRPKRWESDDRDCLIIAGDRRAELADVPEERLRSWYAENIEGNRNSMESLLHALRQPNKVI